jgi:uncharacterized Fe-S cluster protein YjdI
MPETRRVYTGKHVDVSFDTARCRHAAECLRGLPAVFNTQQRPWIFPDDEVASAPPRSSRAAPRARFAPTPTTSPLNRCPSTPR